jgi:hypothetical protein
MLWKLTCTTSQDQIQHALLYDTLKSIKGSISRDSESSAQVSACT